MMQLVEQNPDWNMAMLFDSDRYVVVMMDSQHGPLYEIVDKAAAQEVILTGSAAIAFTEQRERWNVNVPHEEDVEEALEAYLSLARLPLCMH